MKRIGLLTSGGDAPGMNTAIRAIVRTASYRNIAVIGFLKGFRGLMNDDTIVMTSRTVSGIINRGGTILKSGRCPEFKTRQGQQRAVQTLKKHAIDGLIVIGGDGSLAGAHVLAQRYHIPTIGFPASIDNDLYGTDFTLGFDTAVNTALDAIDKLRDTATSHDRLFLVQVMGRTSGYIAEYVGFASGAEEILVPEEQTDLRKVRRVLVNAKARGKSSCIVIVAEGDDAGNAFKISQRLALEDIYEVRIAVLGHVQRGGAPTAADRILAGRLGYESVMALRAGKTDVMVGIIAGQLRFTPLLEAVRRSKSFDRKMLRIAHILAM